ncbi:hypothetical protein [Cuneatibacter caecimuris]|uniref:Uncharacterized protein n=1 Tax=Cuneatibacter caecimuris TaxID=1796618 RepID=A0A4Q7PMP2_9FIRM|nr:hypothetical protein [Cuneatibacter caecimuris]RZT02114.1 hypothetical protein EV209_0219 [Cuneatibacter caecimuris]
MNYVQLMPCNADMYAVFREEDGSIFRLKVVLFALSDDGCVYALTFSSDEGIDNTIVNMCSNFVRYEMEGGVIRES